MSGRATRAVRTPVTEQMAEVQAVPHPDDLPDLLSRARIDLPPALLLDHAASMSALLNAGPGLSGEALSKRVQHAADDLQRLYQGFLDKLPAGEAAASPACQAVASVLVAEARFVNHIHHTGQIPPEPTRFLALTAQHPPSRLDAVPQGAWPPSESAA